MIRSKIKFALLRNMLETQTVISLLLKRLSDEGDTVTLTKRYCNFNKKQYYLHNLTQKFSIPSCHSRRKAETLECDLIDSISTNSEPLTVDGSLFQRLLEK